MARPGMTDGVPDDAAPESTRLDLDPGRNVGPGPGASTAPPLRKPSAERAEASAAASRRAASPASYKADDRASARPWPAILAAGFFILVIVAAIVYFYG